MHTISSATYPRWEQKRPPDAFGHRRGQCIGGFIPGQLVAAGVEMSAGSWFLSLQHGLLGASFAVQLAYQAR